MRSGYFFENKKTSNGTYMIDMKPTFLEYVYPCTASLELILSRVFQMNFYDFLNFIKINFGARIKEIKNIKHLHRYYLVFDSEEQCDCFVELANLQFYAWITRSPILETNAYSEFFDKKEGNENETEN